jgi:hypothetical protein
MKMVTAVALGLAACAAFAPVSSQAQGGPPPLPAGPPPMPQPSGAQYYYNDNGQQAGPFSADQIKQKIASGAITPDTLVWKSGTPNWVAVKDLPEFAAGSGTRPVAAGGGNACSGPTVYISDDFSETATDQTMSFDAGKLKFKALPGKADSFSYTRVLSGDADICVTAQIPHNMGKGITFAGITFGGLPNGDANAFLVDPDGTAGMVRVRGNASDMPVPWRHADGLNPAPGAKNRLHITIKGNKATFFVNEVQFGTFNGPLPAGAGKLGVIVKSEEGRRDTWKFINFRATDFP